MVMGHRNCSDRGEMTVETYEKNSNRFWKLASTVEKTPRKFWSISCLMGQDNTEVNTPAEVAWQTDSSKDDSPQPSHLFPRSIPTGKAEEGSSWNYSLGSDGKILANAHPSTKSLNSGPPTRRWRLSHTSSWSLTIGLGDSSPVGGFDSHEGPSEEVATRVFIKKNHFTSSLENQYASEDGTQKEATSIGQKSAASSESDQEIAEPVALASYEQRVLQLQP